MGIVQARMGSTRLPGKVLKPLAGKPMLAQKLARLQRSDRLDRWVLATSGDERDNPVAALGAQCGVEVFRGSEKDVLDRYYRAAKAAHATIVVRVTGDCPLHESAVIDETIDHFIRERVDYDHSPVNYPEGLDTEVFAFAALERAWKEAELPSEREHVTPYICNHPELFRIAPPWRNGEENRSAMHWSVDTPQDFEFVTKVYEALYEKNPQFSKEDVLALLVQRPELLEINRGGTGYEGLAKSLREDERYRSDRL